MKTSMKLMSFFVFPFNFLLNLCPSSLSQKGGPGFNDQNDNELMTKTYKKRHSNNFHENSLGKEDVLFIRFHRGSEHHANRKPRFYTTPHGSVCLSLLLVYSYRPQSFDHFLFVSLQPQESSSPFKGTLIRIPFRTKESAARSEISKIIVSDEMVADLCQQFQVEAFQWLLFLQNVQEISMSRLAPNGSEPILEKVFSVSLARAGLTKRPSIVTCGSSGRGTAVSTQLEVQCSDQKQTLRKYHLFTDTQHGFRSRVCLAVPLMQEQDGGGDVWCHDEDGRVFCFLPVPRNVDLGLRLHVHAPLNMAQDRRSVLLDNRIGESEQELVRHNFTLLDDLIPSHS